MKQSSDRLVVGVILGCIAVIVACLIFGPFRGTKEKGAPSSGRTPPVVKPALAPSREEPSPVTAEGPAPEKETEAVEPSEAAEEFDITGTVVDKDGNPIESATVEAVFFSWGDFSPEKPDALRNPKPQTKETKADGRFGFKYQEGKRCFLSARKEDYISVLKSLAGPQKDIVITLTLGGSIEGKVVDAMTLDPVTKFRIVTSEDSGAGLAMGLFKKKEVDIYIADDGKEFNNPDGSFRVSGLSEGKYRLTSLAEGYAQSDKGGIEVEPEKTTSGVVIKQQPAGAIAGQVVDPMGKPIQAAEITQKNPLHSTLFGELRLPQRKILATSDPKGEFKIGGLPAGTFTLEARHQDYCPAEQDVKVSKGQMTEGVEFQLVQGGRISGLVVSKVDAQPIADATVKASTVSTFLIPDTTGMEAKTDLSGLFDIVKLEPGTYSLTVSATDFADKTLEDLKLAENESITDLIIELSQGGNLVGTVKDDSGKPMPNMMVVAVGPGGQRLTQSDEQGDYALKNLKEGTYVAGAIEISDAVAMGASRGDMHFVRIENDKDTRLDIVVGGTLKVYGKVTLKGEPQPGAIVSIESSPENTMATKSTSSASGKTDENGHYEIERVRAGHYSLSVVKVVGVMPRPMFSTEIEIADRDLEKNIELPEGGISGRVVEAGNRQPIEGAKVTLEPKQARGVREAALSKLGFYVGGTESTDAEGKYSFSTVEDGVYIAVASKEGYAPQALTASVRNSQGPSNLDFSLSAGETLRGQVTVRELVRPIKQIFLSAKDSDGRLVYSSKLTLTETGEYEATGLAPGAYEVWVDATGYASASRNVRVQAGADNRADFVLTAGGTLTVRAVDERGSPVPGAMSQVMNERGEFFLGFFPDLKELMNMGFEEISRGDGVSVSENLPPGSYRVKVSAMGYEDEFITVTVREGEPTDETATLRKKR